MARLNHSGDPMIPGTPHTARRAMRAVREMARVRYTTCLRRFRQTYGYESQLGPEWVAVSHRQPSAMVTVTGPLKADHPMDREILDTADNVIDLGGDRYAVSWLGFGKLPGIKDASYHEQKHGS